MAMEKQNQVDFVLQTLKEITIVSIGLLEHYNIPKELQDQWIERLREAGNNDLSHTLGQIIAELELASADTNETPN
jgi:hypothetical protein